MGFILFLVLKRLYLTHTLVLKPFFQVCSLGRATHSSPSCNSSLVISVFLHVPLVPQSFTDSSNLRFGGASQNAQFLLLHFKIEKSICIALINITILQILDIISLFY